ncbi:MAG: TonB-dependent receptor [Paludibacter sp.]|nr:TonB-dependent receptor [Paludibacter sp.]
MNSAINNKMKLHKTISDRMLIVRVCLIFTACILIQLNTIETFSQSIQLSKKISGTVTDQRGEPIIGASILVKDTKIGTITDGNGKFMLDAANKTILKVSYIGYSTVEYPITDSKNIIIKLEENSTLNEVVVVGYGQQKKETVTGAISTLGNKELMQVPVSNIGNALVGKIAGLSSVQISGEPGNNSATLRIRGISTMSSDGQEPLIVIDGIQQSFSVLNSIDANEIEGINVLKDASATAVYGIKGANGVIIATTKRGQTGKPQISFTYNSGITSVTSIPKTTNSYEYALFRNQAIKNDGDASYNKYLFSDDELWKLKNNQDYTPTELANMNLTPTQIAKIQSQGALYYTSHDWYKEQYGGSAPQNQYNINISGGSDKVRYFTSVGYFTQEGLIKNSTYSGANANSFYNRYNYRTNVDVDLSKNFQVSVNTSAEFSKNGGILSGDNSTDIGGRYKQLNQYIVESPPFASPGFVDGKLISGFLYNPSPTTLNIGGANPLTYVLNSNYATYSSSIISGSIKLKHTMDYLTKGLSAHAIVSYDDYYKKGIYTHNSIQTYNVGRDPLDPSNIIYSGGKLSTNSITDNVSDYKERKFYIEGAINYNRKIGKNSFTGLALANAQKYSNPGLQYNVPQGLIGLSSRATYNYDERYLLEFNLGYNGSENFPENHRFGLFPAYSAGWIISNEPYFPQNSVVSWLKLRASYGEVGNDKIGGRRFLYQPSTWGYTGSGILNGYDFGSSNGSSPNPYYNGATETTVGNPNVTWERAKKFNSAIELKLFKDRLSMTADFFSEKRDNILLYLGTTTNLIGANLPPANIGKMSNQGYEIQLEWRDRKQIFSYWVRTSLSFAKNKIEYMDEPSYDYQWLNSTGFAYGQYKGYKTDGFYNTLEEVNNHIYSTIDGNKVKLGDLKYVDVTGDGKVDENDRVPVGYSNIPQYSFNLAIGFEYKGFDLSILGIGTANGSFPISYYLIGPFFKNYSSAFQWQYDGQWTPEKAANGSKISYPRASMNNTANQNSVFSDFWLKSNDFLRLKNIEVGYTFNQLSFMKSIGISKIRIYSNANNLWTWTKDNLNEIGIDPEQSTGTGAEQGLLYPLTRVVNFGVKVQF